MDANIAVNRGAAPSKEGTLVQYDEDHDGVGELTLQGRTR
jgi:hypothetical protein